MTRARLRHDDLQKTVSVPKERQTMIDLMLVKKLVENAVCQGDGRSYHTFVDGHLHEGSADE